MTNASTTLPMNTADDRKPQLLVACLCAEWCTACRAYRPVFDQAVAAHADVRFLWVDIEESAALFDEIDIENFPTILIGAGEQSRFFGPVVPKIEVLLRLIAAHRDDSANEDGLAVEIRELLRRLQREGI